ncbi:hypothetical protein Ea357_059 [Erwinia phage Ea35-70]|uniref:Uncharacterized protein n=9 Tax=Agricanvirus TaxID=1984776 RepID=A0A191ZBV4_9CAUD|nr:hypothetical protein Ea357_059 [Erwinia phage Ea35-70]YP_009605205.1 hypothetical protein FDH97_gp062 [Erwinia phage vB_EamM_Deimos-Minion]YP_009605845.1 hypothetical protein FDH99_gp061 [Erwinia phage vB_EamM_Simmy50]YP_009606167.1 hypothetical protein FDI00_gp061 [Erwinia phage vB_EamM_Special G]YP_009621800.1 hypothetical protein FDJ23_gp059 [Erwinia phage vB_EamM_Desertfox]AUG85848.1 hypothetical protein BOSOLAPHORUS_60 [Erwinia phage vB_EamM_Bosolaphorus]AUG86488.1 hypothetical protei
MPQRGTTPSFAEFTQQELAEKVIPILPDYCNRLCGVMISTCFAHRVGLTDKSVLRFAEYHFNPTPDLARQTDWSVEVRSEQCVVYELNIPKFVHEAGLVKQFLDILSSHLELYFTDSKVLLGHVLPPCFLTIRIEKTTP